MYTALRFVWTGFFLWLPLERGQDSRMRIDDSRQGAIRQSLDMPVAKVEVSGSEFTRVKPRWREVRRSLSSCVKTGQD